MAFEKELALFGEEQAEAGQVDLLLVRLDLGEIGVVREVRNETLREPVFQIEADIRVEVVRDWRVLDNIRDHG